MMMAFPDVVVGVDFGMTSTGVAYSVGPEWTRPETIQNWPSLVGGSIADKVATKVAYNDQGNVISWGFMVNDSDPEPGCVHEELFKLYLDPSFKDGTEETPPSLAQARRWFVDYLSCVYQKIDGHLRNTIPRYHTKQVEFRFSVPTTWKDPAMIAETEQLIRNAGFGRSDERHVAQITLTEAEAAAVYASKQQYETGDSFLICDAGGGTTDINILKVISSGVGQTELEPLSFVEGKAIGSTLIDIRMEKVIARRLEWVREHLEPGWDPIDVARQMLRETTRFESYKCNFGVDGMNLVDLRLPIPHLTSRLNSMQASIQDGSLVVSRKELQAEFDHQIRKIISLIDSQLNVLRSNHPNEMVSFIILSGGLGSSPYLQSRLKEYYVPGRSGIPIAANVKILHVPKPQLAVCHGLVLDRIQQIRENREVYKERFCRNSYGIVCRALYNPSIHSNEPTTVDPRDGKVWVEQHIDWFVKQGEKVSVSEGITQHYSLKVPPSQRDQLWKTQVVMSTLPADRLPSNLQQHGARRLCEVKSRLPANMKMKNGKWYSTGDKYLRAEFDMKVIVGPADLRFQTISSDGVLSDGHQNISVEWTSSETLVRSDLAELAGNSPENMSNRSWGSPHSNGTASWPRSHMSSSTDFP